MKKTIYISLLVILIAIGCEDPLATNNNEIVFHTTSNFYSTTDSITVIIENNTCCNFEIALRCGEYLEMYYQKRENNAWSDNIWFTWMTLKCLTFLDTIKSDNNFQFVIPADEIKISGTYRLILANNTSVISNSFEIKQ
jgi:hypothetical protein